MPSVFRTANFNVLGGDVKPYEFVNNFNEKFNEVVNEFIDKLPKEEKHFSPHGEQHMSNRACIAYKNIPLFREFESFRNYHKGTFPFDEYKSVLEKEGKKNKLTPDEVYDNVMLYDWTLMRAYAHYCDLNNLEVAEEKFYDYSWSSAPVKAEKIEKFLSVHHLDVLTIQELVPDLIKCLEKIKGYTLYYNDSVGMLVKSIHTVENNLEEPQKLRTKSLKVNGVVVISYHATSKEPKKSADDNFATQSNQLMKFIKETYKGQNWIVSGDFNHHFQVDDSECWYYTDSEGTTWKMRSGFQAQQNKKYKLVKDAKDGFLTNMIVLGEVCSITLDGSTTKRMVPDPDHPSDHFITMIAIKV